MGNRGPSHAMAAKPSPPQNPPPGTGTHAAPAGREPFWKCDGCNYSNNFASRTVCRVCKKKRAGATPAGGGPAPPGPGSPGKRSPGGKGKAKEAPAGKADATLRELRDTVARQAAELRALQKAVPACESPPDTPADAGAPTAGDVKDLEAQLKVLRGVPRADALVRQLEEELLAMRREAAAARPVHVQVRDAQARLSKKQRVLDKMRADELPLLHKALADAQAAVAAAQVRESELVDAVAAAKAEVARLVAMPEQLAVPSAPSDGLEVAVRHLLATLHPMAPGLGAETRDLCDHVASLLACAGTTQGGVRAMDVEGQAGSARGKAVDDEGFQLAEPRRRREAAAAGRASGSVGGSPERGRDDVSLRTADRGSRSPRGGRPDRADPLGR